LLKIYGEIQSIKALELGTVLMVGEGSSVVLSIQELAAPQNLSIIPSSAITAIASPPLSGAQRALELLLIP
jgi:hypothetical protein